jgi:hypothetical protein
MRSPQWLADGELVNRLMQFCFLLIFGFNVAHAQSGGPPRVINVVLSGSNSLHEAYSFDLVDGSGSQLRTVPVGGADTLSITFNEDVNIQSDHLTFVGMQTATRPALSYYYYNIAARTSVWQFASPLKSDLYAVRFRQAVTDVDGNLLDGEWTNPRMLSTTSTSISEFPSGDGTAGGDFVFVLNVLAGDTNRDNRVNSSDGRVHGLNATWSDGDTNGDGIVNQIDDDIRSVHAGMSATTLSLLADLNGDWKVDFSDLDFMVDNINLTHPTRADGDLDGDGYIRLDDADLLHRQLGVAVSVVPKPDGSILPILGVILSVGAAIGRSPRFCHSR